MAASFFIFYFRRSLVRDTHHLGGLPALVTAKIRLPDCPIPCLAQYLRFRPAMFVR